MLRAGFQSGTVGNDLPHITCLTSFSSEDRSWREAVPAKRQGRFIGSYCEDKYRYKYALHTFGINSGDEIIYLHYASSALRALTDCDAPLNHDFIHRNMDRAGLLWTDMVFFIGCEGGAGYHAVHEIPYFKSGPLEDELYSFVNLTCDIMRASVCALDWLIRKDRHAPPSRNRTMPSEEDATVPAVPGCEDERDHGALRPHELKGAERRAIDSYNWVMTESPQCWETDQQAYDYLKLYDCPLYEDVKLPKWSAWSRALRRARERTRQQKNTPRGGRSGRSIVNAKDIEWPNDDDEADK